MIERWISFGAAGDGQRQREQRVGRPTALPVRSSAGLAECRSVPRQGVGADDPPCQVGELAGDECVGQLAERADRTGIGPVRRGGRQRSGDEQALADLGDVQAHEGVTYHGIGERRGGGARRRDGPCGRGAPRPVDPWRGDALVVEHRRGDAPAGPGRWEHRVGRHEHVGRGRPRRSASPRRAGGSGGPRTPGAARSTMSIDRPSCLAALGSVRASTMPKFARWAKRRPDLLAVDQPAARRRDRPGLDTGDVGPGTGFGEQLAPHLASGEDARHVPASLRIGAELQQRRQAVAERDRQLLGHQREATGLLPPRRLVGGGQAAAAEGRRHAQPGQAGGVQRALEAECPIQREVPSGSSDRRVGGRRGVDAEEAAGVLTEAVEVVLHGLLPARVHRPPT